MQGRAQKVSEFATLLNSFSPPLSPDQSILTTPLRRSVRNVEKCTTTPPPMVQTCWSRMMLDQTEPTTRKHQPTTRQHQPTTLKYQPYQLSTLKYQPTIRANVLTTPTHQQIARKNRPTAARIHQQKTGGDTCLNCQRSTTGLIHGKP